MSLSPTTQIYDAFWADVVLTAASTREPFEEVSVITLHQFFAEKVYEHAISVVISMGMDWGDDTINRVALEVIQKVPPSVAEQVVFNSDGTVLVVIDVPVIDDSTVFAVMNMISRATEMPRMGDTVILGAPTTYSSLLNS